MKNIATKKPSLFWTLRNLFMTAFADEPTTQPTTTTTTEPEPGNPDPNPNPNPEPQPSGQLNFEDLIAKARKEERDKLYPEIEKHKKRANDFLLVIQERDESINTFKAQVSDLEKKLEQAGKNSGKPSSNETELQATVSRLESEIATLKATHQKDLELKDIEVYRVQKLAEAGPDIIPEFVSGHSKEEIDASIESAKTRYQEIVNRAMGGIVYPSANIPSAASQLKLDKTPEEISRMSASEYAEWRKANGIK